MTRRRRSRGSAAVAGTHPPASDATTPPRADPTGRSAMTRLVTESRRPRRDSGRAAPRRRDEHPAHLGAGSSSACQVCGSRPGNVSASPVSRRTERSANRTVTAPAITCMHLDVAVDRVELVPAVGAGFERRPDELHPRLAPRRHEPLGHAEAAEVDVRGVGAGDALDLGLGEEGADGQREHLAELHERRDARRRLVALDAAEEPLRSPVDSATCASVRFCAIRVLRSFAPMGVPSRRRTDGSARMRSPHLTATWPRAGVQWPARVSPRVPKVVVICNSLPTTRTAGIRGPGRDASVVPRFAGIATFARLPRLDEVGRADVADRRRPVRQRRQLPARARASVRRTSARPRGCCGRTTRRRTCSRSARSRSPTRATSSRTRSTSRPPSPRWRPARSSFGAHADRLVVIGGDHTVALPLLRAVHAEHGPVAVLHFDAHLDTWDTYFGAPMTHGTPFRRASEEGLIDLTASMHVGIRGPLYARATSRTTSASASRSSRASTSRSTASPLRSTASVRGSATRRSTSRSTSTCSTPPTRPAPALRRPEA